MLYSFSLLYSVFRSIFNSCAALLLLFPVWRNASNICSFSVSSLRNDMLVVQVVVVSSKSVPNSSNVIKLPCASKVALFTIDAGFPANDNSIKLVTLLRRNQSDACPIPCLPDQGRSWRIAGYLLSVLSSQAFAG